MPTYSSNEEKLKAFSHLFLRWNASINLSAARDAGELEEHVADCLHLVPHVDGRVLDVGAGGGLPGVVLALSRPDIEVVSLEPVRKKLSFLNTARRELGLSNFEARGERLEDHAGRDYDRAVSRATFDLALWFASARHFVRPGGVILGMEAVRRSDVEGERIPYLVAGKNRTIVLQRVMP